MEVASRSALWMLPMVPWTHAMSTPLDTDTQSPHSPRADVSNPAWVSFKGIYKGTFKGFL